MNRRLVLGLLWGLYGAFWAFMAIEPIHRMNWFIENLLVFLFLPTLYFLERRIRFSITAHVFLVAFMMLHAVGSHWSYVQVPLPWAGEADARNDFDRIVHFTFGLLLLLPAAEAIHRRPGLSRLFSAFVALSLLMTASAVYEILEWGAVMVVAPDLGSAFLGAQGDEFDATKDMALALLGGVLAAVATYFLLAPAARGGTTIVPQQGPSTPRRSP